jgi:hypothetical protein
MRAQHEGLTKGEFFPELNHAALIFHLGETTKEARGKCRCVGISIGHTRRNAKPPPLLL